MSLRDFRRALKEERGITLGPSKRVPTVSRGATRTWSQAIEGGKWHAFETDERGRPADTSVCGEPLAIHLWDQRRGNADKSFQCLRCRAAIRKVVA